MALDGSWSEASKQIDRETYCVIGRVGTFNPPCLTSGEGGFEG